MILGDRVGRVAFDPFLLNPRASCVLPVSLSCWYIIEDGRELLGVPLGVPFGVDDALSTLAFREPDRGVMLELKKALTGVSIAVVLSLAESPTPSGVPFCTGGDAPDAGDAATFGSKGVLPDHFDEFAIALGRPLVVEFCFGFIRFALPCRVQS